MGVVSADRRPLVPQRPRRGVGWARGGARERRRTEPPPVLSRVGAVPTWAGLAGLALLQLVLGTWGFLELGQGSGLTFLQSLFSALGLYTLSLNPATGPTPRPNWQIWAALVLAVALIARGILALARDRIRRGITGHLLSGHVIICGAGMHGTRLARVLSEEHDVVLIDSDPSSAGMQELRGAHEWRLLGDAVSERTLRGAGSERAHWVIAMTGDDFVNSQIVSAMRSQVAAGRARDRVHVLVQLEDPALARFIEEEAAPADAAATPVISPFSAQAIAAEALLDEAQVWDAARGASVPLLGMHEGAAPNLLLAGDHPLIDALVLAVLRRWRVRNLRELESAGGHVRPPIHVSLYGPGAESHAARLRERWRPEPEVLLLEARDSPPPGSAPGHYDEWLHRRDRGEHAIVACRDELAGIALTLTIARALGDRARLTRVTTQFENALDAYVEERTARSRALASTQVRSLADLGARPEAIAAMPVSDRLARALRGRGGEREADAAGEAVRALLGRPELSLRSDPAWRFRPSERPLLEALLTLDPRYAPIPLSAVVRAGLRLELDSTPALLLAARRLTAAGSPHAFAAWCTFIRQAALDGARGGSAWLAVSGPSDRIDRAVTQLLLIKAAAGGDERALGALREGADGSPLAGATRVTILAGAAGSMGGATEAALESLLERALAGFDGILLSGGTAVGMPGIAGRVAHRRELSLVGYVPEGEGSAELYPRLRVTSGGGDFSVLEPLSMWRDIVLAGFPVREVRLLVCPGGSITLQEIALARAMGARIAWLDPLADSPRSLDDLVALGAAGIIELPSDPMTIRAFISPTRLPDELRDAVAHRLHDDYRRAQRNRKPFGDPALARWDELPPSLRASNLALADDIPNKLALIGKRLARPGGPLALTPEQIERLAEVEHGRWTAERLEAGWRWGPREVGRSTSPDLIPWDELPEAVRDYDREAVRTIAPALAHAGWGVEDV